jgi:hypothetical protein
VSYTGKGIARGQVFVWDGTYRWMPIVAPSTNQVLTWNGSQGVWAAAPSGFTAGGDLASTPVNQTVIRIRGYTVAVTAPTEGQVLTWVNGSSNWAPAAYPSPMYGGIFTYLTVAAAQAATGWNGKVGYVVETDTIYRYVGSDASSTTADGLVILSTANGGNTRWMAIAGRQGNVANSELPTPNSPTYGAKTNAFLGKGALGHGQFGGGPGIGAYNTDLGCDAGGRMTQGLSRNTYVGYSAGFYLYQYTSPYDTYNTCLGVNAGGTSGSGSQTTYLTAVGNSTAAYGGNASTRLIAIGSQTGYNTRGTDNICLGSGTGSGWASSGYGSSNIFIGGDAGYAATTGQYNVCFEGGALLKTGSYNVHLGLCDGTVSGSYNVTLSGDNLTAVTTGSYNTALGYINLYAQGTGLNARVGSLAIGYRSGGAGKDYCICIGEDALNSGWGGPTPPSYDIAIGQFAMEGYSASGVYRSTGSNIAVGRETTQQIRLTATSNLNLGYRSGCGINESYDLTCIGAYTVSGRDPSSVENVASYGTEACGDVAIGSLALEWLGGYDTPSVPTFTANTAVGCQALGYLRWGLNNVGIGFNAGYNPTRINNTTSVGSGAGPESYGQSWTYVTRFNWSTASGYVDQTNNLKILAVVEGGSYWLLSISMTVPPPLPHYGSLSGPASHWLPVGWFDGNSLFGRSAVCGPTVMNSVRLGQSGNACYGGTYNTDSDIRLKTNIEPCDLGLEFIKALQPRKFEMKDTPGKPNHGLIAQEVGASLDALGVESNIHESPPSEDAIQSVGYEALVAPLVQAVQELAAKVAALRTRVAVLKNGG